MKERQTRSTPIPPAARDEASGPDPSRVFPSAGSDAATPIVDKPADASTTVDATAVGATAVGATAAEVTAVTADPALSTIDGRNAAAWGVMLDDPESALILAVETLEAARLSSYDKGTAESLLNAGWCCIYLSRPEESSEYIRSALEIYGRIDDASGQAKATHALGVLYHKLSRLEWAVDYYSRSIEIARKHGLAARESSSLNKIGEVCKELGNFKEALDYFLRAYEILPDHEENDELAGVLLNIGATFTDMENYPLARDFIEKSLAIAERLGEGILAAQAWSRNSRIDRAVGDYANAELRIRTALDLARKSGDRLLAVECLLDLGSIEFEIDRLDDALAGFMEAIELAERLGAKLQASKGYEALSRIHERKGEFGTALEFYRKHSRYEREISGEDTTRKIKNIQIQYEIERSQREAEIYRLRTIDLREKTDRLEAMNRRITTIAEIGRRITSSLVTSTVIDTLFESLIAHFSIDVFGLALYNQKSDSLRYICYVERGVNIKRPTRKLNHKRSIAAYCVRRNEAVFIHDIDKEYSDYIEGEPVFYLGQKGRTLFYLPLSIENKVIGVMTVQNYEADAYTDDDRKFLAALNPFIAVAIENSLIHDRLEDLNKDLKRDKRALEKASREISHLANHDSLTGLPNRRLLFELLEDACHQAERQRSKIGVMYIDLDDFKPINDRYGHFTGDHALIAVAERFRNLLRASDIVARVGGDEFVAVLRNVKTRADIELVADKIQSEGQKPLAFIDAECRVRLSMGIAVYPDDAQTIEDLVNRADGAMYAIKHGDKNGYAFYSGEAGRPARGDVTP
ncbi:MAG: diguanylate cyclase [Spirochaetes bacterium]|nr:diguanylate cyclase [Spirochaetota bacterium]